MRFTRRSAWWIAAGVGVLLLVPLPRMGRAGIAVQDLGHVPIGAALALLAYVLLRGRGRRAAPVAAALALALAVLVLAAVEVVQPLTHRTRSLADLEAGALGAAGALAIVATWPRAPLVRVAGLLAGVVLMGLGARPAATTLYDVWRQRRDAPMLASFEDDLELSRWWFGDAVGTRTGAHATAGLYSLRVDLHPARWPGATMGWPLADWRGYRALALDLYVDGTEPLDLVLKVSDAEHDGRYEDRFHETLHLEPGAHRVRVPLERIEAAPAGRRMDLGRIAGVQLFVDGLDRPRTFYLDALRLLGTR